jgi:hypothetical protein
MYDAFTPGVAAGHLKDPGASGTIRPTMWGQLCAVVTEAAEARTLAQPDRAGILHTVCLDTDGGDLTLTVSGGYNNADDTSLTFGDAGDMVVFQSIKKGSNYLWRAIASPGVTL